MEQKPRTLLVKRLSFFALVVLLLLDGAGVRAETVQQDRRIEEEKREELKPTVLPAAVPSAKPPAPAAAPPAPPPIAALYFATLAQKQVVFRYDAAKAIVILMGVDEEHINLDSQVAYLKTHGLLPPRFTREEFDPRQPLRKGEAAYIFLQALKIKGGVVLHLLGPSERYALKELAFQGLMSPGHVRDLVSGVELVQLMDQAARHKLRRTAAQQP